jgi:GxxExxY protein
MNKREINQIGFEIISCAIDVHKELGPGLLESVYEKCMIHELLSRGFETKSQVKVPVVYKGVHLETDLKADIVVNDLFVLEIKSTKEHHPVYESQTLTYMKLLKCPKGIIINFFTDKITDSAIHLVNELFRKLPN